MVSTKSQNTIADPIALKKALKSTSSTTTTTNVAQLKQKNHFNNNINTNNKNVIGDEVAPPPPGTNEGVVVRSISSDSDIDSKPLLQRINWLHFYLIVGLPLIVFTATFFVPIRFATVVLGIITYNMYGMGITMGYHRLLSHRSYDATPIVHFVLLLLGAGAFQGSARWWSRNHRAHHRYVDTDKDPYNAKRGLFYSHVGWMLVKQNPNSIGRVDISDLDTPLLRWQHDNYLLISGFMSFLLPTAISWIFWNDPLGGFFYAGIARLVALHHATFCINSLAHLLGSQEFSEDHTAADSYLTALVTFGEGYHNWHHTFASDYRNGIRWYHWDPAKWAINVLSWFGMTFNINAFPDNLIQKTILQLKEHKIHEKLSIIDKELIAEKVAKGFKYPLEEITLAEMKRRVEQNGEKLVAVGGKVLNVEKWGAIHPGGSVIINAYIGKDASSAFNGVVHPHSNTAHNVLDSLTVAILQRD